MTPATIVRPIVTDPQVDATQAAQGLANVTKETAYVVANQGRYFIGSATDLAIYHQSAIRAGLTRIVATVEPII